MRGGGCAVCRRHTYCIYTYISIYTDEQICIYICRYRNREIERDIKSDMTFFSLCDRTPCMFCMPSPTVTCGAIPCPTPHAMPTLTPSLMASSRNPFYVPHSCSCTRHRVVGNNISNNRTRGKDVSLRRRVPPATEL